MANSVPYYDCGHGYTNADYCPECQAIREAAMPSPCAIYLEPVELARLKELGMVDYMDGLTDDAKSRLGLKPSPSPATVQGW